MSGLGDKLSGPPIYIWPWPSAIQILKLSHPKGMQQTHTFRIQCPILYFSVFSFTVALIEIIVQICFLNFLPYHSPLDQWSPAFLAPGTGFVAMFSWAHQGDALGMIQTRYIYCVLFFYHYNIISTSDCQALNTRGWGPLLAYSFPLITNQYLRWWILLQPRSLNDYEKQST